MKPKLLALVLVLPLMMQSCATDPTPVNQSHTGPTPQSLTIEPGDIITIAGQGPAAFDYTGDGGLALKSKLDFVTGVSVDALNNVYILGGGSNTIRMISASDSIIQTIAGVYLGPNPADQTPLLGDNGPAIKAHLNLPLASDVDVTGNVIVIDGGNQQIREVRKNDGVIHKLAGNGFGYEGDGGQATSATFNNPYAVACDAVGNVYVADAYNHVIRMITRATGVITTIAGKGPGNSGYSGDNGLATSATLNAPRSVDVDANGNIYISDSGNNVIRKINNGTITTIAGTGSAGYSGDGGNAINAKLHYPGALAVDNFGNVFFVDSQNNVIRKIDTAGKISTYVGTGASGYTGDGGPATKATIASPWGIATDLNGNLYIADTNNAAVRVVIK
jgi:sugar lactone lactonase YvrE